MSIIARKKIGITFEELKANIENYTIETLLNIRFIQGNSFDILKYPIFIETFDGIVTDVPFKFSIKNQLFEYDFSYEKFFNIANWVTKKDAFIISFCNMIVFHELYNYGKKYGWDYHTYMIREKTPHRTWISWRLPLRTTEFIIFLKRGDFQFCFKDGTIKERPNRAHFGGDLKRVEKDMSGSRVSHGMYSDIINAPAVKKKERIHPTQKPKIFSDIFSRVVGQNKIVIDNFTGSGALIKKFPNALGIDRIDYWNGKLSPVRKKRECYHCKKKLGYLGFRKVNKEIDERKARAMWNSKNIKLLCCACYKNTDISEKEDMLKSR